MGKVSKKKKKKSFSLPVMEPRRSVSSPIFLLLPSLRPPPFYVPSCLFSLPPLVVLVVAKFLGKYYIGVRGCGDWIMVVVVVLEITRMESMISPPPDAHTCSILIAVPPVTSCSPVRTHHLGTFAWVTARVGESEASVS